MFRLQRVCKAVGIKGHGANLAYDLAYGANLAYDKGRAVVTGFRCPR